MNSQELRDAYADRRIFVEDENGNVKYVGRHDRENPFEAVKEFHTVYGQPVGDKPHFLDEDRMALRKRLIEEEYAEFLEAVEQGDLVNAFKELADLVYVVEGTAVEMGGNLRLVFNEVHLSNMSKLDENGEPIYREDGKVLKGPNYREPNIKRVLGL